MRRRTAIAPRSAVFVLAAAFVLAACSGEGLTSTGTTGGTPSGTKEFPISVTGQDDFAASAATDGTNELVEWSTQAPVPIGTQAVTPATVSVQLFTTSGTAAAAPIVLGTNVNGDVGFVSWNGSTYLATYEATIGGHTDVYGQFVSRGGAASGAPFPITTSHDAGLTYGNVFGGGTHLVAYTRIVYSATFGDSIFVGYARFVSPAGVLGPEVLVNDLGQLSIAYGNGTFLAAYNHLPKATRQARVRTISVSGTAGTEVNVGPVETGVGGTAVEFAGGNFLVAWNNLVPLDSTKIATSFSVQAVTPAGAPVGGATTINIANSKGGTIRSIDPAGQNFIVVWSEGVPASITKAQFFTAGGTVTGAAATLFAPDSTTYGVGADLQPAPGGQYLALINRRPTVTATLDLYGRFLSLAP